MTWAIVHFSRSDQVIVICTIAQVIVIIMYNCGRHR